jgi:hypothetical protein
MTIQNKIRLEIRPNLKYNMTKKKSDLVRPDQKQSET